MMRRYVLVCRAYLTRIAIFMLIVGSVSSLGAPFSNIRSVEQLTLAGWAADKTERIALVVGNAAYRENPLHSPVNDGRAISQTLLEAGFDVMAGFDLTKRQLEEKIDQFGAKLKVNKGTGLFYYSGHGMQVDGENFLLPIDFVGAGLSDHESVADHATSLDFVLSKMEAADNRLNLVILDACRDNPFGRNRKGIAQKGLGDVEAPSGTLIAYATAPNHIALDGTDLLSPYTEALVSKINSGENDIFEILSAVGQEVEQKTDGSQKPWFASSLRGTRFCFRDCEKTDSLPVLEKRKGKVFFFLFVTTEPADEAFYASGPLQDLIATRLKNAGVTGLTYGDISETEGAIFNNADFPSQKDLLDLPVSFASWFFIDIHQMTDLPNEGDLFVSQAGIYIEASFPSEDHYNSGVKGFGKTPLEARQDALLKAAKELPDSFFRVVYENSQLRPSQSR